MNISQSKNNIYTKGLNDIDAKVLSIVKRFLENDPEKLYGSIDYIVLEVLRRVKEEILNNMFIASVSSVNGKNGVVVLNAKDVDAEPIINKESAFNKPFGKDKNTVCEGNDIRLSDKREPLSHKHEDNVMLNDLDNYIEKFLNSNGIFFENENNSMSSIVIKNRKVSILGGEIEESKNNG